MAKSLNLNAGQRAQRKLLITVAEWALDDDMYNILSAAPADFATEFANYYKKVNGEFTALESAEPFRANMFYEKFEKGVMVRQILGARTEDSSIELNPDTETSTDILGITYSDVNKTEPQQDFDPMYIIGGSKLAAYLVTNALANNIDAYNNIFNVYVIAAFIDPGVKDEYYAVCHSGCTILPTSLGGDSYTGIPVEVHFSNNLTEGTVDKLTDDFTFTAKQ